MTDFAGDFGYTDGDVDTNRTDNPTLESLVSQRYSRRQTMLGGISAASLAFAGSLPLAACGDDDDGNASDNTAPTVTLPGTIATSSGRAVTLAGTATDSDGSIASSRFEQISGPAVALNNANSLSASFVAPSVAQRTDLVFRLTVADDRGLLSASNVTVTVDPAQLGFEAVAKNRTDVVTVPAGYSVTVLYRTGDPLNAATPAYRNDGTDTNFAGRAGDHHDALYYYGLAATGNARDDASNTRGLLVMNHENIVQLFLHPRGPTTVNGARPEAEAIKEIEAHGVSVVEVTRAGTNGGWSYIQAGALNRRITPNTPTQINGPVRGNALVQTAFSPAGTDGRGTINNCANGYTPWGTNLTCEENWAGYFRRPTAADNPRRPAREAVSLARYGVTSNTGNYGWATVTPADPANTIFRGWDAQATGASATADYRYEPNQFGWVVEIDPYDPAAAPRKRTALGRMGHEGAWPGNFVAGVRPAWYMGDDSRGEYVYKFVSAAAWDAADAQRADRLAVGDKYLDQGTLYVARFNADGTGSWIPLVFGQVPNLPNYTFADQADVLINTRLAADAVGATRMDRPEWTGVNPRTGEMYVTMTNNNTAAGTGRAPNNTNAANPRSYADPRVDGRPANTGNPNGHIVRLREAGDTTQATTFRWDIYVFGAGSDLDRANVNVSGLTAENDMSSPDGLWFARPTNASGQVTPLLWIQNDDGAYTDVTNNMMLVAIPGQTGDGGPRTITNNLGGVTGTQATVVGKEQTGTIMRRFLVGPNEAEITGIDSTPDGRTIFVNIQHPGEDTTVQQLALEDPRAQQTSIWPLSQAQDNTATGRPRSATIVITKNDGGVVGL